MKTTLDLPDDLMRGMKIRAATQGRKLKDVIADAIRDSLVSKRETTVEAPPLVISRSASGFPYIKALPGAQKPAVTAEEIQRLIEESQLEEDLQRAGISL
ncbi:MAG: hypothetical protein RLZZ214_1627 [Verrucomicrobiota bacterium]|jgi:hypothetical protein